MLLITLLSLTLVMAETIEINAKNSYNPGEKISVSIFIYSEGNKILNEPVNIIIKNNYAEIFKEEIVNSGEAIKFTLPENALRGHWAITAKYKDIEKTQLFNVMELEKAEIILDNDILIVKNVGNIPYRKSIQIAIGEHEETAFVPLGVGETKEIKLNGNGVYDVRVSDGTKENTKIFQGVELTGNVVGLESDNSFIKRYKVLILFIVVVFIVFIVISVLRFNEKKK